MVFVGELSKKRSFSITKSRQHRRDNFASSSCCFCCFVFFYLSSFHWLLNVKRFTQYTWDSKQSGRAAIILDQCFPYFSVILLETIGCCSLQVKYDFNVVGWCWNFVFTCFPPWLLTLSIASIFFIYSRDDFLQKRTIVWWIFCSTGLICALLSIAFVPNKKKPSTESFTN